MTTVAAGRGKYVKQNVLMKEKLSQATNIIAARVERIIRIKQNISGIKITLKIVA